MMRAISLLCLSLCVWAQDPLGAGIEAYSRGDYPAAERELRKASGTRASAFLALTLAATSRCEEALPGLRQAFAGASEPTQRLAGLALGVRNAARVWIRRTRP